MQSQAHIGLLGDRQNRLDEVAVIGPHVVGRIGALEALLLDLRVEVVHAELARAVTAWRLDHLRRIGVAWMKVDLTAENPGAAEIAQKCLKLFDVLVPPWLAELQSDGSIGVDDAA